MVTFDPPDIIEGEARVEWDRVTKALLEQGRLSQLDRGILCAYCEVWATFLIASRTIKRMGLVVKTKSNNIIPNPALGIRNTAAKMIEKFSKELGFTPVSRERRGGKGAGGGMGKRDILDNLNAPLSEEEKNDD